MKIVKSLKEIKESSIALTIGNFDGVHLGHRFVLDRIKRSLGEDEKLVVISFNPHPATVLSPKLNYLINSDSEKFKLLEEETVDYLYEIDFSRDLSTLSGPEFLDKYIYSSVHKIKFFLGYDFSFGANKKDGVESIEKFCKKNKYDFETLTRQSIEQLSISSSLIRDLLIEGKIAEANKLLGRDFFLSGTIVKGDGRGRQIGFPTANMSHNPVRLVPGKGVYHTSVLYNEGIYKSITNIGVKPTFESDAAMTVETYLLDFDKYIYGEKFDLFFHSKLRDEKKFDSVNDLIAQISKDVESRRNND